jgi:hypothetical protein
VLVDGMQEVEGSIPFASTPLARYFVAGGPLAHIGESARYRAQEPVLDAGEGPTEPAWVVTISDRTDITSLEGVFQQRRYPSVGGPG